MQRWTECIGHTPLVALSRLSEEAGAELCAKLESQNPGGSAFAVAAGLEQVVDYIKNLHFDPEDIDYLRSLHLFDERFFDYLKDFRFTGELYSVPEGTVVLP